MRYSGLIAIVALAAILLPSAVTADKIGIPEDTEIRVRFDQNAEINSEKLEKGAIVPFFLSEDIVIIGKTIIAAGAEGTAKVEEVVKASKPGKPGMIKITFVDLGTKGEYKAAGDGKVMLAGSVSDKGGGRKIISWIFIFGLFIKGGQGEIDTALDYTATIAESIILESN